MELFNEKFGIYVALHASKKGPSFVHLLCGSIEAYYRL